MTKVNNNTNNTVPVISSVSVSSTTGISKSINSVSGSSLSFMPNQSDTAATLEYDPKPVPFNPIPNHLQTLFKTTTDYGFSTYDFIELFKHDEEPSLQSYKKVTSLYDNNIDIISGFSNTKSFYIYY